MKKDGEFHLQLYASSPAPKRDYHGLTITSDQIILNSWDISHGPHVYPRRRRLSLDNFPTDKAFCADLQVLFGRHVVDYANRVAEKDSSLYTMPEKVFRKIVGYLAIGDIVRLGQSSKIFFELCNTNAIWKIVFRKMLGRPPTKTELDVSQAMSWRHMLHRRVMEKRENKKISENFKQGIKNLQQQTKKEAERIRQSYKNVTPVSFERNPPEDKVVQKIQIRTFKATDQLQQSSSAGVRRTTTSDKTNITRKPPESAERKVDIDQRTKSGHMKITRKSPESTERKVDIDQRTKSSHMLRNSVTNATAKDKDKKLNKCAKDLQNLKSKSVFL